MFLEVVRGPKQVLGTELESFEKVENTINQGTISPATKIVLKQIFKIKL